MTTASDEKSAADARPAAGPTDLASAVRAAAEAARVSLPDDFAGRPHDAARMFRTAREAGLGEADLCRAAAKVLGLAFADDLRTRPASLEFVERVPIHFARQHGLLGLASAARTEGTESVN